MSDNRYQSDDHLTFSQRYGYESVPEPMQLEELSGDLRREIWNAMRKHLDTKASIDMHTGVIDYSDEEVSQFIENILGRILRRPEDEIDTSYNGVMSQFKSLILQAVSMKFSTLLKSCLMIASAWRENLSTVSVNRLKDVPLPIG